MNSAMQAYSYDDDIRPASSSRPGSRAGTRLYPLPPAPTSSLSGIGGSTAAQLRPITPDQNRRITQQPASPTQTTHARTSSQPPVYPSYPEALPKSNLRNRHRSLSTIQSESIRNRSRYSGGSREVLVEQAEVGAIQGAQQGAPGVPTRPASGLGGLGTGWVALGPIEAPPPFFVDGELSRRVASQDMPRTAPEPAIDAASRAKLKHKPSLAKLFTGRGQSSSTKQEPKASVHPARASMTDIRRSLYVDRTSSPAGDNAQLDDTVKRASPAHKRKTSRLSIFGLSFLSKSAKTRSKDVKATTSRFDARDARKQAEQERGETPPRRLLADTTEPSFGNAIPIPSPKRTTTTTRRSRPASPFRPSLSSAGRSQQSLAATAKSSPRKLTHYPAPQLLPHEPRRSESSYRSGADFSNEKELTATQRLRHKSSWRGSLRRVTSQYFGRPGDSRPSIYGNASTLTLRPAESNLSIATGVSNRSVAIIAATETTQARMRNKSPQASRTLTPSEEVKEKWRQGRYDFRTDMALPTLPQSGSQRSMLSLTRKRSEPLLSAPAVIKRDIAPKPSKPAEKKRLRTSKSAEPIRATSRMSNSTTKSSPSRYTKMSTVSSESARERSLLDKENAMVVKSSPKRVLGTRPAPLPLQPAPLVNYQGNSAESVSTPSLSRSSYTHSFSRSDLGILTPPITSDSYDFPIAMQTSHKSQNHHRFSSMSSNAPPMPPPQNPLPPIPDDKPETATSKGRRTSLRHSKSLGDKLGAEVEVGPQTWQNLGPTPFRTGPARERMQQVRKDSLPPPNVGAAQASRTVQQPAASRRSSFAPRQDAPASVQGAARPLRPNLPGGQPPAQPRHASNGSVDSVTLLLDQQLQVLDSERGAQRNRALPGHAHTQSYPEPYRRSRQFVSGKSLSGDMTPPSQNAPLLAPKLADPLLAGRVDAMSIREMRTNWLRSEAVGAEYRAALAQLQQENQELKEAQEKQKKLQARMQELESARRSLEAHRLSNGSFARHPRIVTPTDSLEGSRAVEETASIEFSGDSGMKHDGRLAWGQAARRRDMTNRV